MPEHNKEALLRKQGWDVEGTVVQENPVQSEELTREEVNELKQKLDRVANVFERYNNYLVQNIEVLGINELCSEIDKTMMLLSLMQKPYSRAIIVHLLQEDYIDVQDIQDIINRTAPTRTP